MNGRVLALSTVVLLAGTLFVATGAQGAPAAGDQFSYDEVIALSNGAGNFSGYTESTTINGSLAVTAVASNGTASAFYYNADSYQNSTGNQQRWTSSGRFTFSTQTFLYVSGTDNQTGYVNPTVWFLMDPALPAMGSFELLNTAMTVVATNYDYSLQTSAGSYVEAVYADGTGSYARNDQYGAFTAQYDWKAYFDPSSGYIIGYAYTEQDSDGAGDGFTLTDTLAVTHTSYALTPGTSASSSSGSGSQVSELLLLVVILVAVVVVIVIAALLISRAHRRQPLPKHSPTGQVSFAPPPAGPPPPGIRLTPSGQPAVQQIVIKETVKVNCRYCGSLIDTTADKCPFCGATRS